VRADDVRRGVHVGMRDTSGGAGAAGSEGRGCREVAPVRRNKGSSSYCRHGEGHVVGRGYENNIHEHHKRDPGFFATKIQKHFEFRPAWYRASGVRDLVLQYYLHLRSVLKSKPHLRPCVARCRHCRIPFLTHPCNARRRDLGCPFGCKEAHRRRRSTERSSAYYKTEGGKVKKKRHNGKRSRHKPEPTSPKEPERTATSAPAPNAGSPGAEPPRAEFDPGMVEHLRIATSLIEGRKVSTDEILQMLTRIMRQHSLVREKRIDYVLRYLTEKPP